MRRSLYSLTLYYGVTVSQDLVSTFRYCYHNNHFGPHIMSLSYRWGRSRSNVVLRRYPLGLLEV